MGYDPFGTYNFQAFSALTKIRRQELKLTMLNITVLSKNVPEREVFDHGFYSNFLVRKNSTLGFNDFCSHLCMIKAQALHFVKRY